MSPTVSVIIPTRGRPEQVVGAIHSVLAQQLAEPDTLEILVILDGPDETTARALQALLDPRIVTIELPTRRGHATARNAGIEASSGLWCAFLDDDDTWLPDKLCLQLSAARHAVAHGTVHPVVGCIVRARAQHAHMLWPARFPGPDEPIADYLYGRSGWRSIMSGYTLMQTSMILLPTPLAKRIPFRAGMRRHADPDWLLRLQAQPGVRFVFPPTDRPLAEWNLTSSGRVSSSGDYRYSIHWARRHAKELGPRAIAGFLTGPAAHIASQIPSASARRRAFVTLLREAVQEGEPAVWDLAALAVKYLGIQNWRGRTKPARRSGESV